VAICAERSHRSLPVAARIEERTQGEEGARRSLSVAAGATAPFRSRLGLPDPYAMLVDSRGGWVFACGESGSFGPGSPKQHEDLLKGGMGRRVGTVETVPLRFFYIPPPSAEALG